MAQLWTYEYGRVLDLAAAIVADMSAVDPYGSIASQVNDCFRGSITAYQSFETHRGTVQDLTWAPESACSLSPTEWERRLRQVGDEHPLAPIYARQETLQPLRIGDVASDREWRRTLCYDYIRRDMDGATRQLGMPLPASRGVARAFLICRPGMEYSDRECDLARRLQPLLLSVDRHLVELRRLKDATGADAEANTTVERNARALNLTARELTVLGLLAEGLTSAAIARRLAVTTHTVNKHLENTYRKLEVRDRMTAVLLARDLGLVAAPDRI